MLATLAKVLIILFLILFSRSLPSRYIKFSISSIQRSKAKSKLDASWKFVQYSMSEFCLSSQHISVIINDLVSQHTKELE